MIGNIHSTESFGTVDGPGVRYVVFTQGCLLRCQYCHNADTWEIGTGKQVSVDEIMAELETYLPFIQASNGGLTVSGGEPLLQLDFLRELYKACKEKGVHTCLDTSGGNFHNEPNYLKKLDEVLEYTDLIMLDLKQIDLKKHIKLTGKPNTQILEFAKYLAEKKKSVWIRHVLVPGKTDDVEDLQKLADFISTLGNVEKVEVLPYHKLGVYKWETLGLQYPLEGVESPSEESVQTAEKILFAAINK